MRTWRSYLIAGGVVAVTALVGFLIYWEASEPSTGVVIEKRYFPAWETAGYFTQSCMTTDKGQMRCTLTWVPPVYHPECYEVAYYNESAGRGGDTCVAPTEYALYEIGTEYPR